MTDQVDPEFQGSHLPAHWIPGEPDPNAQLYDELEPDDDYQDFLEANDEIIAVFCQGNLLKGYNMAFLRHLVVRVEDAAAARQFLYEASDQTSDWPRITTARNWEKQADPEPFVLAHGMDWDEEYKRYRHASEAESWDGKPATCLNVGITATGLKALGLDDRSYMTFPEEFRQGAARRAYKVGDVDGSDPEHWRDGFDDEDKVHLMWTVHSGTKPNLDAECAKLRDSWNASGAFSVTSCLDGAKLPDKETHKPGHDVHFGYRDDISQPRLQLLREDPRGHSMKVERQDRQPAVYPNALLQGTTGPTSFGQVEWQVPALIDAKGNEDERLSQFGCYNAFRVMEQDVVAFEDFLEREATDVGWNKEYLAAKLMGRWRNGVPLVRTPNHKHWSHRDREMPDTQENRPHVTDVSDDGLNEFDYATELDLGGRSCPIGSHIRRSNPRSGRIVQRSANHTRPIVRRAMPYGPPFDPNNPEHRKDKEPRGLLGSFFCGSLISQFESMMYDWINMGLQDPRITGTNCPIIGANHESTSRFDIDLDPDPDNPDQPDRVVIRGFPRFVETVGAAYLFYPGLPGLRLLAELK